MIRLGDRVKDKVNGFTGIVTTVADHLTGCRRFWVEGPVNEKGESKNDQWIDEVRLELIELSAVTVDKREVEASPAPSNCGHPRS